jgi:hypothetical protein
VASPRSIVRIVIFGWFLGLAVLNVGVSYLAFDLSGARHPEKLDELRDRIERGEVEVTVQRYLSSISAMKRYVVASEQLTFTFQRLIALLAAVNLSVALIGVIWFWRMADKLGPVEEPDR